MTTRPPASLPDPLAELIPRDTINAIALDATEAGRLRQQRALLEGDPVAERRPH